MRTFNNTLPCQSCVTLDGITYKLKKLKMVEGNGFSFSVENPSTEPESIHLPTATLKALYLLITENEKK